MSGVVRVGIAMTADMAEGGQGQSGDCSPPRRGHGMPDDGVVTLDEQPDEKLAFGPASPLVAEWREFRARSEAGLSRVDRVGSGTAVGTGGGDAQGLPIDPSPGDGTAG